MVFAGTRANQRRGIFSSAYQYVRPFGSFICDLVERKESTTASGGRSFRCCRKVWTDGPGRFPRHSRSRRPPDSTSGQRERRRNFRSSSGWSSGLSGPPASLQILAFGDFSHGDRYREQQVLLRRKRPDRSSDGTCHRECYTANRAFCLADIDKNSFWDDLPLDGLDGPRFLSACPSTGLMESP
jgi:hypothetical protein